MNKIFYLFIQMLLVISIPLKERNLIIFSQSEARIMMHLTLLPFFNFEGFPNWKL